MSSMRDGRSKTKLYRSWVSMKRRCDNPTEHLKKYYGGIKICKEWYDFDNFKNWALKNNYVEGYSIERLDNLKGYCPENCIWIPKEKQNYNKRNKSHLIIDGVDKTFTEWSRECGIGTTTIRMRIKYGWKGKDLLKPVRERK